MVNRVKYDWTGVLKGDTLTGRYRGANGDVGGFVLQSQAK
jgi:hypothetical protein